MGYIEPGTFDGMTEDERDAVLDECFEHNDHHRANGHLFDEVPIQPPETALTLYSKSGKVATTDGPYGETKEQLGGIQVIWKKRCPQVQSRIPWLPLLPSIPLFLLFLPFFRSLLRPSQ